MQTLAMMFTIFGMIDSWQALNTIIGLILLGIILDAKKNADGSRIGFRYWNNPGPFVQYMDVQGSLGKFKLVFGGAKRIRGAAPSRRLRRDSEQLF